MERRTVVKMLAGAGAMVVVGYAWPTLGSTQIPPLPPPPLLPLFPLNVVLLPGNNLPLHIFEPRYREMIQECIDRSEEFGVLRMRGGSIAPVGCTARITDVIHRYRDGRFDILSKGERRFRIVQPGQPEAKTLSEADFNSERAFFRGVPAYIDDDSPGSSDGAELIAQALEFRSKLMALIAEDDPQSQLPLQKQPADTHPQLSFQLMDGLPADVDWKQELLELRVERERLVRVVLHLQRLMEIMQSDPENPSPARVA